MSATYVGFYWTLPVSRIGFRHLPKDVDEAARVSMTIRYQRDLARRYVRDTEGRLEGRLLGEIAFMDARPDRATEAVREALARVADAAGGRQAAVIHVAFEDRHLWRNNPYLVGWLREQRIDRVPLEPEPITIDGVPFDPIRHFEAWRERDAREMTALRLDAYRGLRQALAEIPEGAGRWRTIADRLNAAGTRTVRGSRWKPENVRKLSGRMPMSDDG